MALICTPEDRFVLSLPQSLRQSSSPIKCQSKQNNMQCTSNAYPTTITYVANEFKTVGIYHQYTEYLDKPGGGPEGRRTSLLLAWPSI
jgi:hypothetical protein